MTASDSQQQSLRYRRVLLKISGESLADSTQRGICMNEVGQIAAQIKQAMQSGCQVAVVSGGGNILRGGQFSGGSELIQEATAHYMGMMATVINCLALQDALESIGCSARVMSSIPVEGVCETFDRRVALRHLEKQRVVILAAGIGRPFVTTDTAAAQRGLELGADVVLKATRVDGVYSDDPEKNPNATLFQTLTFDQVVQQNLRVMDATAIAMCREHDLPILVFNFKIDGNIVRAVAGETIGTRIGN